MNEFIGYKVVHEDDNGKYWSAIEQRYPVNYRLNETSIPLVNCGPLTLFKTKEDAVNFSYCVRKKRVILKVSYVPSKKQAIWRKEFKQPRRILCRFLDEGTVLAESITPIEVV